MNRAWLCVLMVRPMDCNDPCLARTPEGLALDNVVRLLRDAGLICEAVVSMPDSVPDSVRKEIDFRLAEVEYSRHEHPQRRLLMCMQRRRRNLVLVLTSYSVLMDANAIRLAMDYVAGGRADAAYPVGVVAPKFFMVLNERAVSFLSENHRHPLSPFAFPGKLDNDDRLRLIPIHGLEGRRERFLWELLFAGERNAIPPELINRFLSRYKGQQRTHRQCFDDFINGYYELSKPRILNQALKSMEKYDSSLRLAMHLNYAQRLCEHLPQNREVALEIGHGATGLTSLVMALIFNRVLAADTQKYSTGGFKNAVKFLDAVQTSGLQPLDLKYANFETGTISDRTHFYHSDVRKVPLESCSLDFCFSRMVFEHISDVPRTSRFLARLMRPGSVMVHEIGLQDHCDLSHIHFDFLRHSPEQWAVMGKGTNLWRVNDFESLWEDLGFDVKILERNVRPVPPEKLHPCWKGYRDEDLYCYRAIIKASKRPS